MQSLAAVGEEVVLENQIFGWISADGQFRKGHKRRPRGLRSPRLFDDQLRVALQIPDGRVDLRKCDPQLALSSMSRTSFVFASNSVLSPRVSTFTRTTGSVFDIRTLNRQVGNSTLSPSNSSIPRASDP